MTCQEAFNENKCKMSVVSLPAFMVFLFLCRSHSIIDVTLKLLQ